MASKLSPRLITWLIFPTIIFLFLYSTVLPIYSPPSSTAHPSLPLRSKNSSCDYFSGRWVIDPNRRPFYDESCPFHRNAWNCLRNKRENMDRINSWKWVPGGCDLPRIDPFAFLTLMRNRNIGFIGDSLNQNFLVSFICILRVADMGAKKWKKKGAWVGAYFPNFNVTVAYHRAVLLAKYDLGVQSWLSKREKRAPCHRWQPHEPLLSDRDGLKGINRVDVDIPAKDWADITNFYDVLVFNTGHWWGYDKFPKETPLVFCKDGKQILPPLGIMDGLKVVLENMVAYVEKEVPTKVIKFWRLQSPRHFYGGDWNENGSCLFNDPLHVRELDSWFDPGNNEVNQEARKINQLLEDALRDTDIRILNLTHLSEFRADAHPAIWLGKKDAVAVWGQDCMHWCLPGVPDTWVDILAQLIHLSLDS